MRAVEPIQEMMSAYTSSQRAQPTGRLDDQLPRNNAHPPKRSRARTTNHQGRGPSWVQTELQLARCCCIVPGIPCTVRMYCMRVFFPYSPLSLAIPGSHPSSRRNRMNAVCPFPDATISGVHPACMPKHFERTPQISPFLVEHLMKRCAHGARRCVAQQKTHLGDFE